MNCPFCQSPIPNKYDTGCNKHPVAVSFFKSFLESKTADIVYLYSGTEPEECHVLVMYMYKSFSVLYKGWDDKPIIKLDHIPNVTPETATDYINKLLRLVPFS
jgi:hypothetical protein